MKESDLWYLSSLNVLSANKRWIGICIDAELLSFAIHYYCEDIKSAEQRQQADALLQEADCAESWNELKGCCRCYRTILEDRTLPAIQQKLAHKISLMAKFEKSIRQKFSTE